MTTMFSENKKKRIPKSFKDCYRTDSLTNNLWEWCERLEKIGLFLFWVIIVVGVISTIVACAETVNAFGGLSGAEIRYLQESGTEIPNVFIVFIKNALLWALYAFIEYFTYHVLALLVGSIASIVQNTRITADLALYNAVKSGEGVVDADSTASSQTDEDTNENITGTDGEDLQEFSCPECHSIINGYPCKVCDYMPSLDKLPTENYGVCELCYEKKSELYKVKITDKHFLGNRHRKVCDKCIKEFSWVADNKE